MPGLALHTLCAAAVLVATIAQAETTRAPQITPQRLPVEVIKVRPIQDKGAPADSLTITPKQEKKDPFDMFSGGPAGFLLSQYLKTTADFGPDAARHQRMALDELQQAPANVKQQMVSELVAAYGRLPEADYERRWLLIDTLAQLDREEAVEHLGKIALSDVPPERIKRKDDAWSSRDEEISIRLAAVRGLSRLSARQVQAADTKLVTIAGQAKWLAIKKHAIQGYLDAPAKRAKAPALDTYRKSPIFTQRLTDLKKQLPPEARKLADEVGTLKPDLGIPEEVKKAVQEKKTRKEPQKQDPPPAVQKGGRQ